MNIEEFKLERILSIWQHQVKYDLTESGVNAVFLKELISSDELDELHDSLQLKYIQTNGTIPLRESISSIYEGSDVDNILVTNGSAEANFIATWKHIEPGDEVVFMIPNYMQIWGLARALGARIKTISLKEDNRWELGISSLREQISPNTKMIIICNPNNPTGSVMSEQAIEGIIAEASRVGAWILSDEVYRGAELNGKVSPGFWNRYDKVLITAGLSKAYALPGLRIGWLVGPKETISQSWAYHDYTSITTGTINDRLARVALKTEIRQKILSRNREISKTNLIILKEWLESHPGLFKFIPPQIGGIAFIRYNLEVNSTEFVMKLIREKSVFIVPGDCFGMDHFFRINYGAEKSKLLAGLNLISETIEEIRKNR